MNLRKTKEVRGLFCGENRHVGEENLIEFYITNKNCFISLVRRDAIISQIKLKQSWRYFFSNGGTKAFRLRVSTYLGIKREQVKVVNVKEGSVIVDYQVTLPEGKDLDMKALETLKNHQEKVLGENLL